MVSIAQSLEAAQQQLTALDTGRLDSELLLAHILKKSRTWLRTWPEKKLTSEQLHNFEALVSKRKEHQPVAYLLGEQEFFSLLFKVNDATLIPRPETELLVETILHRYQNDPLRVLDLGCGSGCIAIALSHTQPGWSITAVEQSEAALAIAKENNQRLNTTVHFIQGSWFTALDNNEKFDVIVSNPPYVENDDVHLQQGDVQFEPLTALISGKEGLNDIKRIIEGSVAYLKPNGMLIIEHGYDQAKRVADIMTSNAFADVVTLKDLAGHGRATLGYLQKSVGTGNG